MDSALRSTNSQYDDQEILNNLDVRLMSNFEGDTGWDVFSLQYTIQGPLLTMLEVSMPKYLQLFKHLWRLKHMEYVLSSKIWKDQKCNAKVNFFLHLKIFNLFNLFIHLILKKMNFPPTDSAQYDDRIESSIASPVLVYIANDQFYPSNSVLHFI